MRNAALYLLAAVSFGVILSEVLNLEVLHWICKPAIMISLGIYYIRKAGHNRSAYLCLGIFFSFVGDTALMGERFNPSFFMIGLGGFLTAHVFYIFAYREHRREGATDALKNMQQTRLAFPIVLTGTGLMVILHPTLGDLKIPVMIYAVVLVLMVLQALFRYGSTNNKSFQLVFAGAVLFMVSDSLLAINKFLEPIGHAGMLIMIAYITAQFLIVEGLLLHSNSTASGKTS